MIPRTEILRGTCCDGQEVKVVRTRVSDSSHHKGLYNQNIRLTPEIVTYKALIYHFGKQSQYNVKRVGFVGSSSTIGQIAQSIGSYALPGNISPYRSPVRSAVYSALIPGAPGVGGGVKPGRKKTYRCPEGYQYGGRFTDNRLSTCGQQLFDIPNPLGAIIGAVRTIARAVDRITGPKVTGTPLGGGEYSDPLDSRRPQIPRVAERNEKIMDENIDRLLREMGQPGISASRMVRRDGFVLEPVVSPRVLRTIPDNRDMEGATFILTAGKLPDLGQDELGLLSNTGVEQLVYVLPGGSTLSLKKVRPLTIGERRKLGRTVNAAASMDNSKNPSARLQEVAKQTGDGIEYSENFIGLKNPHEILKLKNGRTMERWVHQLLGKRPPKPKPEMRESSSSAAVAKKITSLQLAAEHLAAGGALSAISPSILGQALAKASLFKRDKRAGSIQRVIAPDGRDYLLNQPKGDFDHLNATFASDMQQHLGLESPDVFITGTGNRRPYLVQSISTTYPGVKPSTEKTLADLSPREVARLMISDFISGVENRSPSSVEVLEIGDDVTPITTFNDSNMTALADLKIRQRTEQIIASFRALQESGIYGKYYRELKEQQRRRVLEEIRQLIQRARLFNYDNFLQRLAIDGELSDAETRHLKIVQKIAQQRVDVLEGVLNIIGDILKGKQ